MDDPWVARLAKEFPTRFRIGDPVEPYRQVVVRNVKPALLILLGAVALVLLMAAPILRTCFCRGQLPAAEKWLCEARWGRRAPALSGNC